ncbi:MAG TPA: hypothetical protein VF747_03855, partial [Blastocatellia bacterium]
WRLINGNFNDVVPSARPLIAAAAAANDPNLGSLVQANRRFPTAGPITKDESTGDSSYHALQVWVNRRFSDRLAFQAAYTWGHTISNVPTQSFISATTDVFDYNRDKGNADLDRRHMFVFNAVYSLPSFQSWGTLPSKILGDWQLNGIASFFGGTPLNIISGVNTAGLQAALTQRPNLVPGVPIHLDVPGDAARILNPAAFSIPAPGQFGNLGRGVIRGPGINNIDFSMAKNWRMRERYGLQFRAEMFNVFNHANFRSCNLSEAGGCIENNLSNGSFGRATSTRGPREIQFGLKFNF